MSEHKSVPAWAMQRARELCVGGHADFQCHAVDAFASYIADHEAPPFEPLLIEAREIAAGLSDLSPDFRDEIQGGRHDHSDWVSIALAALKRGIELAGEQK